MSRSRSFPFLLGLAVAGLALLPAALPAQDDSFRTGTHVLRRLLHERKFKALTEWKDAVEDPERTLLILLGKPVDAQKQWSWRVPGGLRAFVDNGGAVLLASDQDAGSNGEVGAVFGYYPMSERVSAWRPGTDGEGAIPNKFIYRGMQSGLRECIIVEPTTEKDPPLFRDNKLGVVTNKPGVLWPFGEHVPDVRVLAQFPRGCWYTSPPRPGSRWPVISHDTEKSRPFAVSREVGRSRLLMLADHSVFINEMVLQETNRQPDNGNLDFTYEAIEWLRDNRRDRVLIIEDGEIQSQLDAPLSVDPNALRRLLRAATPSMNDFILDVQEKHKQEHHLDETLIEGVNQVTGRFPFRGNRAQNYYLVLIALAVIGLVLFGLTRLVRATHRGNLTQAFTAFGAGEHSAESPLTMRESSALAREDLREYAREAVREWFIAIPGCPADPRGVKSPRIDSHGGWWARSRLRNEVRALWRLANGRPVPRMSQKQFSKMLARLEVLRRELDAGRLRIEW
jgi:hypothetical protein